MSEKISRKAEVLAAILIVLFSAIVVAGSVNALEPQKRSLSFVLLYHDVETNDIDYLSNVAAYLYDVNGNLVAVKNSTSNGIVEFSDVVYGNYVISVGAVAKGNYVYDSNSVAVKVTDTKVINVLDGGDFTKLTVERHPLSKTLNLTITNGGLPVAAQVSLIYNGCTYNSTYVDGNSSFKVPKGINTIKVVYQEGGVEKDYYKDVNVIKSTNVSFDLKNYKHIIGTVSSGGEIINTTTHIIVLNKTTGKVWNIMTFPGGAFSFYLPNLNYELVVTADGYGMKKLPASNSVMSINLGKVTNSVNYNLVLSKNMKWINSTMTMLINNKSVINSLPYADAGILYYQLKLLGWTQSEFENYLKGYYTHYTSKFVSVDNNIYELKNVNAKVTPNNAKDEEYTLQITASYYNSEIKYKEIMKDGSADVAIYAKMNAIQGAYMNYQYTLKIPSKLERSNDVSGATVSGYVNSITIKDVKVTPVHIILKERKKPSITLDSQHFVIGWNNITNVNHVVNQSAKNYTVVVPAGKKVWFNASQMAYDEVRDLVDYRNTTYIWKVDNKSVSPTVKYNLSYAFAYGKHVLTIKVVDVGGNTNTTNITVLADGFWPTVNITFKEPAGKVLATFVANASKINIIEYNITGTKGRAAMNNKSIVKINTPLVLNESQEVVYDASATYDTYNGVNKTGLPVIVEWNFNGNKSTGMNRSYAFDKPTRHGNYTLNITIRDSVNNTIIITMPVQVKDITKPVVKLNLTANGKHVDEVKEGENITLDATGSYDPENGTIASYKFTIKDEKFKQVNVTDGVYDIINGSFRSGNVTLVFHKYGTYYIIVNVTDAAGNYNVVNRTLRVTPVRPDLTLNSVQIKGDRIEGTKLSVMVNVSNNGDAIAKTYWIAIYINGKVVVNKTFKNLKNGSYVVKTLYWTPSAPGNYTVKVVVGSHDEPASYRSDNTKTETVKIEQAPWKIPAMIGGAIAIIAIGGYIGWRYMEKKGEKKKFKKKSKGGKKEKE